MRIGGITAFRFNNFKILKQQQKSVFKPIFDTVEFQRKYEPIPVYIVRAGNINDRDRYNDVNIAAQKLSTGRYNITSCMNNKVRATSGYFVFRASDVEISEGKLDKQKLEKLYQARMDEGAKEDIPVYVVKIGDISTLKRYDDINLAASALSTNRDNVANCAKGNSKSTNGHFVFLAKDIETLDKKGNPSFNKEKFKALYEKKLEAGSAGKYLPVYVVDTATKKRTRYDNKDIPTEELGLNPTCVSNCLRKRSRTTKGFYIFYAKDIEYLDEHGKIQVDEDKYNAIISPNKANSKVSKARSA